MREPGGLTGALRAGVFPLLPLSLAMVQSNHETVLGMNGLFFGALIIVAGFVVYFATGRHRQAHTTSIPLDAEAA